MVDDIEPLRALHRCIAFEVGEILEEADYLFNDDRNEDDVANVIQNRAGIYISEKKDS